MTFASALLENDVVRLTFSNPVFINYTGAAGILTCQSMVNGAATGNTSCTNIYSSSHLVSVTISKLCPCAADTMRVVRIYGLMNLLESSDFEGTLTVNSYVNTDEKIGQGVLDMTTIPTLFPQVIPQCTVTRGLAG
jgi:GTP cyclohydrolase FolE2